MKMMLMMTFADQCDNPAVEEERGSSQETGGRKLQTLKLSFITGGNFMTRESRKKWTSLGLVVLNFEYCLATRKR